MPPGSTEHVQTPAPEEVPGTARGVSSAGVDMPILVAPIGVDGARAVIKAFRR